MVTADSGENADLESLTPGPGNLTPGGDDDDLGFPVGDGDYLDLDDFGEPPTIYGDPDTPDGTPQQDLDTPPEGNRPAKPGQTAAPAAAAAAAKAPAPDEYAWLTDGSTPEQQNARLLELAQSDPDLLRRGLLRHSDYTRKTSQLAEQTRALQAQQALLAAGPPPPTPAVAAPPGTPSPAGPAPVVTPQDQEELVRWAEEYKRQRGDYPTPVQAQRYLAQLAVAPVDQRVAALEQTLQQQREAQVVANVRAQWREIQTRYPEATTPGVEVEVAEMLQRMQSEGAPGDVERAFLAVRGKQLLEGRDAVKTAARTAQAAAAAATPAAPPSTGGARNVPTTPPTTNIDQIARQQKRSPVGQRIQQAFGRK